MLWILRLRRWVTHPPSPKMRRVMLGVVIACIALYLLEQAYGWPDWLTVNKARR